MLLTKENIVVGCRLIQIGFIGFTAYVVQYLDSHQLLSILTLCAVVNLLKPFQTTSE
jgi:hypothetical protein